MDIINPLLIFKEFDDTLRDETNKPTYVLFYLIPLLIALVFWHFASPTSQIFRWTLLAYSIFVGFSLNLFALLLGSQSDRAIVKEVKHKLKIFTLFEAFLGSLIVAFCLLNLYLSKIMAAEIILPKTGISFVPLSISTFIVYFLVALHLLNLLQAMRNLAILTSKEEI